MSETSDLQHAAERTAIIADRLSAGFARQLAAVFKDAERRLRAWLDLHSQTPLPLGTRAQIRNIVQQAGFDALARAGTEAPFRELAATVIAARRTAGLAVDATAEALTRLDAWRQWHLDDLVLEGSVLTRSLGDAVMRGFGRSRNRLPADLADILDSAESRVQTLYDTAVSVYGRQVEAEQAGDDPATAFVYMGPVDAKTREFCLEHVGRVYTRSEIDGLDNEQLSNVFLTGGGYNCRHVWQEIAKSSELYQLLGTDQRAKEIQTMVTDARQAA